MTRRRTQEPETPAAGAANAPAAADVDFESAMRRLETIVQELESGQVPLERAMQLFEEGLQLGQSCRAALDAAEARVEKLLLRGESAEARQPFEPAP